MSEETEKVQGWITYIRRNWKTILFYILLSLQAMSLIMGWGGYSYVFAIKSGGTKATISLEDRCLDSLDEVSLNDLSSFVPKKPKYFVVHCTASKGDQTENDLWRVFSQRFSNGKSGYNYVINQEGVIYNMAPVDGSPYLEWEEIVNGVRNMNSVCISVAITGGYEGLSMTDKQLNTLRYLYLRFKSQFPEIQVTTHREVASKDVNKNGKIDPNERIKACPNFDADMFF